MFTKTQSLFSDKLMNKEKPKGPIRKWFETMFPPRESESESSSDMPQALPHYDNTPAMKGLEALTKVGHVEERTVPLSDEAQIKLMLELMRWVAEEDGIVGEKEVGFIESFLEEHLAVRDRDDLKPRLIEHFNSAIGSQVNLKNSTILLKGRSKPPDRKLFINAIYELAYLHGIDPDIQRDLMDIGRWLDMSAATMRQAAFSARQKTEGIEGNINE